MYQFCSLLFFWHRGLLSTSSVWLGSVFWSHFLGTLLGCLGLELLGLSLDLGSSLVVVWEVAGLAHAHGVEQSVGVLAVEGVLVTTELAVARGAHVLGVVLSVHVRAFGDSHHVWLLKVVSSNCTTMGVFLRNFFLDCVLLDLDWLRYLDLLDRGWLFLFSFLDELFLDEILK